MPTAMSAELFWLLLTTFMTTIMWVPYIVNRITERGFANAIWDPQGTTATSSTWADRMMRAHQNAIENLVLFAPLVLMVELTGMNNTVTATACMVYFLARLVHYLVFTFGVPVLRVVSFAVATACLFMVAFRLFGIL
jgi:uncharacterized MAPEG superfamily protein